MNCIKRCLIYSLTVLNKLLFILLKKTLRTDISFLLVLTILFTNKLFKLKMMVSTCEGTHELLQARFCFLQLNNTLIPDFPAHFSKSVLRRSA